MNTQNVNRAAQLEVGDSIVWYNPNTQSYGEVLKISRVTKTKAFAKFHNLDTGDSNENMFSRDIDWVDTTGHLKEFGYMSDQYYVMTPKIQADMAEKAEQQQFRPLYRYLVNSLEAKRIKEHRTGTIDPQFVQQLAELIQWSCPIPWETLKKWEASYKDFKI